MDRRRAWRALSEVGAAERADHDASGFCQHDLRLGRFQAPSGCSYKLGLLLVDVVVIGALLFWVDIRALIFGNSLKLLVPFPDSFLRLPCRIIQE